MQRTVWNQVGQEFARGIDFRGSTARLPFQIITLGILIGSWTAFALDVPLFALLALPLFAMIHVRRLIDMGWTVFWSNLCIGIITATFVGLMWMILDHDFVGFDITDDDLLLIFVTMGFWLVFIALEAFYANFDVFLALVVVSPILLPAPILTMIALCLPTSVPRGPDSGHTGTMPMTPRQPWGNGTSVALMSALLALGAAPTLAQNAPDACLSPERDIDTALVALTSEGWAVLPDGTLPQDIAEQLLWLYVADYATGDTGGETLAAIADLQALAVKGLARKRDIPTSKTRILTGDAGAMVLIWRAPQPNTVEMQCKLALTAPDTPGATPFTLGPIMGTEDLRVKRIALDRTAIAAATGREVITAYLIETWATQTAGGDE